MFPRPQVENRQKTADTKILNSRKLPLDFFSHDKRPLTPPTLAHSYQLSILP
jgi:hypothetical protein